MKIVGILVLLLGLLFTVIGVGGAVMNFVFPPKELTCQYADADFKKAEEAVEAYRKAKGTPGESIAKAYADSALETSKKSTDACASSKASVRKYGFIFLGVAVFGFVLDLIGLGGILLGFRKKKA